MSQVSDPRDELTKKILTIISTMPPRECEHFAGRLAAATDQVGLEDILKDVLEDILKDVLEAEEKIKKENAMRQIMEKFSSEVLDALM